MDRRSSRGKVRLDADLKANILKHNSEGMSPEDIAAKFEIHAEYVRRVVKKAMIESQNTTPVRVSDPTPQSLPRSRKKQKTQPDDRENIVTRAARSSGKKRKQSPQPTESTDLADGIDVEMADVSGVTTPVPQQSSVRRRLTHSLEKASTARKTTDQSCFAAPETCATAVSPFKINSKDASSQTTKVVMYDQQYIDFLKDSQKESLRAKDEELAELKAREASLRQKVQKLESELKREREKAGFERGWVKHF